MTTFDNTGNLHGDDGKFAPQNKAEASVGDLPAGRYQPVAPSDSVYTEMRAVRETVDNWQALLDTAEAVDLFIQESDLDDTDRARIRYVELSVVDGEDGKTYQATALDVLGQDIGGPADFDASPYGPEIPPQAFLPSGPGEPPSGIIDLTKIRSYDWVHGRQAFRDDVVNNLDAA